VLPLSPTLAAVLDRRRWGPDGVKLPPHAHVFGNAIGERVGKISTAWETAVLKAHGVPVTRDPRTHALTAAARAAYAAIDLVFPDLRHEAASRWLERGLRLEEISHLLGHTSYETTRIYLNARPEDLAARFLAVATAAGADAGKFGARLAQTAETERKPVLKMVSKNRRKPRKSKDLA
jgi:integrase